VEFLPYDELGSTPNIIVDGAASAATVLALSHWPKSGTPVELKRDTSAEIVFAYVDSPNFHVEADAVSNNHFDEDGLIGIFALVNPAAEQHRELLIDVATVGDFGAYKSRDAARIAFTLSAFANRDTSPLPKEVFQLSYSQMAGELYNRILKVLPDMISNISHYEIFWRDEDKRLTESEQLLDRGEITIEEHPAIDLALVRLPTKLPAALVHRFTQERQAECHPFAIHNRTNCSRILIVQGQHIEFQYRYESWVQFVSRRPPARIDLTELATELNQEEASGGKWTFDGVDRITPKLHLSGAQGTSIPPSFILTALERHLDSGIPAWDPYDVC
jgi:hypothetical protein